MKLKVLDQYNCMECENDFWVKVDVDPETCPYCGGEINHDIEFEAAFEE